MVKSADKLVNKKIVVVGGTSGIGFGAAQAFIDAGSNVVVISSNQGRVDEAVKRLNSPNASGIVGNVREEESFLEVLRGLAPVDHIVFSGVDKIIRGKLEELNLEDAKFLFGVKFWGAVTIGKGLSALSTYTSYPPTEAEFFKAVKKYDIINPGGSLTLTSGTAALKPGKGASTGGALNGGVISLTKGLAGDLAEKKIRVNVVTPGLVKSELWTKMGKTEQEQQDTFEKTSLPVGFVATPDDIAEAYLYLAKADYATGTSVEIGE
ncbi:Short-chain dehydrogenase/reductase [Lachnellula subtilissima]|uniref:Short-chain dehydrogenase/reductase n=1 Tax=Lachnellula subtilissima TaxID=602034 RepID=A0A8H8RKY5_9HELO|nr:Short-chain dehydrogenase/reductase [Lachnellula subtilissima]